MNLTMKKNSSDKNHPVLQQPANPNLNLNHNLRRSSAKED
jgi:hypothetical protein